MAHRPRRRRIERHEVGRDVLERPDTPEERRAELPDDRERQRTAPATTSATNRVARPIIY